jgi:hypothetical protein
MIPYKLYMRLTDMESDYLFNPTRKAYDAITYFQDEIGFPFKANQEQLDDWNNINRNMEVNNVIA